MLVFGYYHYPCQCVISFVLFWLGDVRTARRFRAESLPSRRALERIPLFFQLVGKGMDPRLRGDDRVVA